jgi:hypothetical protein
VNLKAIVMPAQASIHGGAGVGWKMDAGLRQHDGAGETVAPTRGIR